MNKDDRNKVGIWLLIGVFMLFMQIVIGGVTRLTGSGLSITKWEIVTGTVPPLSAEKWQQEFDLYKASPQYDQLNRGMSLSEFKFIYFWEYFHRLWARMMGFVFLFPFLYFFFRKKLPPSLVKHLGMVILLAMLVASIGWIMVKSGLVDKPWVNPYKLSLHLILGFSLYTYVWTLAISVLYPGERHSAESRTVAMIGKLIIFFLFFQIIVGGCMSGMKAALFYPSFPDMNGEWIPSILFHADLWNLNSFIEYDRGGFAVTFVQFFHRAIAYLLFVLIAYYAHKAFYAAKNKYQKIGAVILMACLFLQIGLGILTLLQSLGSIPVSLGVLHQAGAILMVSAFSWSYYHQKVLAE